MLVKSSQTRRGRGGEMGYCSDGAMARRRGNNVLVWETNFKVQILHAKFILFIPPFLISSYPVISLMVKLSHCRSDFLAKEGENPWDAEVKLDAEKKKKKIINNLAATKTFTQSSSTKGTHFAKMAHKGGVITSNKSEAVYKFLNKKLANGVELSVAETKNLKELSESCGGSSSSSSSSSSSEDPAAMLAKLEHKAKEEEKKRREMERRKSVGGGANKDCRDEGERGKKKNKQKKKGKKSKSNSNTSNNNNNTTAKKKQPSAKSMSSTTDKLSTGLCAGRTSAARTGNQSKNTKKSSSGLDFTLSTSR